MLFWLYPSKQAIKLKLHYFHFGIIAKSTTTMEFYTWLIGSTLALIALFYWYSTKKYQYWSSRGIDGPTPTTPFGNALILMTKTMAQFELEWFQKYGKIYGTYLGFSPVLTIADPELVKQVLVKDFSSFVNRRSQKTYHEVANQIMFFLEGEKWKRVRSIASPTFTTGKLRSMQRLMNRCVDKFDSYLQKVTDPSNPDSGVINAKDVISGFTIDVIASTTFATETNANDDRTDSKNNPLLIQSKNFFKLKLHRVIPSFVFPLWLNNLLGIQYPSPPEAVNYFINLTKQILASRMTDKSDNKKRNDLVQLLLDASIDESELANGDYSKLTATAEDDSQSETKLAQNGNPSTNQRKLTENEIIAQCIQFFVAGFETTATTITHLIYELAVNPDIQQRLLDEIQGQVGKTVDDDTKNSEQFFDKVVNKIPYLDAVIKETLRKYPPAPRLERQVGVDGYKLGEVELSKDQLVEISVYAMHHSSEYYPDPERFNPDRFMPENKDQLVPYTYLPFGQGPRNCIGMRFAYQEIKLFFSLILPRYRFEPTPQTNIPIKFLKGPVLLNPGPIPIKVSRR